MSDEQQPEGLQPEPPHVPEIDAGMQEAPAELVDAGLGARFGAILIDGFIVTIGGFVLGMIIGGGAPFLAHIAYYTYMIGSTGQTVGKRLLHVKVVNMDGSKVDYLHAGIRSVGYLLSGLLLCIGYIIAFFTDHRRALHDYLAGTRVVAVG